MPLKDVKVSINIKKAAKLTALGKPVILAKFDGPQSYTSYSEAEAVGEVFGKDTIVHKLAETLLNQGDTSTATIAIATYNPTAEDPEAVTSAKDALVRYYDEDWYFVVSDTMVASELKEIADYVEGQGFKIHGTTVDQQETLKSLQTYLYDRTFCMYHLTPGEYPAEALIGGHGSKDVGSITYKDKKLVGITPQEVTTAELADIEKLNAFMYVSKFGYNVTSEGTVLSGEFIDVMHSKDWIKVNVETAIQHVLLSSDKIAYDDGDIQLLATAVENVLLAAVAQRMIARDEDNQPLYTINTVKRADTNPADRAARVYKGLSFSFELAGAIHSAEIKGEIVI